MGDAFDPKRIARHTFSALAIRNFRVYFFGHFVSVSGLWMQRIAQSWLVLDLTGSGTAMGTVTALQFLPIWLVAPLGGRLADRVNKRRTLLVTQSAAGCIALTLGLLVVSDAVDLWMVYALALALGVVGSVDNPNRQAFVAELVGPSQITNAVALNAVSVNIARVFGPALAGVLIVAVGTGVVFLIDAVSYVAIIVALLRIRDPHIERALSGHRTNRLRDAVSFARGDASLRLPLLMIAIVSAFSYQFEVIVPLMARYTFKGDADIFGLMFAMMGIGAVGGGLYVASRPTRSPTRLANMTLALGISMAVASVAPNLGIELVALIAIGFASAGFLGEGNSRIQISSPPDMLGRMMAIHALALLGVRPLFAPAMGWIGEHLGPRVGMGIGAAAALALALWAKTRLRGAASDKPGDNTGISSGSHPS